MKATITVCMDNDAFTDDFYDGTHELARILKELSDNIVFGHKIPTLLFDANGNPVGKLVIK